MNAAFPGSSSESGAAKWQETGGEEVFHGVQLMRWCPPPPSSVESRREQHAAKCGRLLVASVSRFEELRPCVHFELQKLNDV